MTFYVSPFRVARHRAWPQPYRTEEEPAEMATDVFVPVNVKAENDDYIITALLPGVKSEDLSIQVINETVTIKGELKAGAEDKESYLLRECPTGRFQRVLRLPVALNPNKAEAELTDGILTLRVPKAEEARPRMIKVTTSKN